jgi:hypothetical protein
MGKPKFLQVFAGASILWVGILFLVLTLALTLLPQHGESFNNYLSTSTSASIFVAVFLVVYIECALWWTRQSLRIDKAKLEYADKSLWTHIAVFFQYAGIAYAVILALILLALTCLFLYITINLLAANPLSFSSGFFIMAGIYVVYAVARNPVRSMLKKSGATRKLGSGLSTYTLTDKGLTIDLKIKNLKDPSKSLVTIGFSDIDEIRTFSFVEAQTFLKYEVGPNLEIVIRQTKDLHDYVKGKIDRPSVYAFTAIQSVGKIVLLKGPDLFYFLAFDTEDVSDLINAFNSFKASRGHPRREKPAAKEKTPAKAALARKANFCTKCGAHIAAGANFCNKCGKKLR